ncbi:BRO1 domain-containing protein BROX-like [Mizuhopecten yessoensis]|uniref:BRO1 domain-containing protein BROX n=1 Tax=Mizuhopecten yessoensis TaxID=6573 RepID=A0A210QP31_MIZYE|nr:BRO1 domain-containing protein BROX-like [Mizuhopecten yessoensis]OWF50492.1 BRO1 domain-containing protein BROX [Mizuhopecten yessoensis]
MAYWFHRNPLKATSVLTFELRGVSTDDKTRRIFTELRQTRNKLLELLTDPNHEPVTVEKATTDYFSLLMGLIQSFGEEADNKLRKAIKYKWTNSLLGNTPMEQFDAVFEAASMAINIGLWYTKHAAKLAAKEEPEMEEAKEVHKCLKIAAGLFTFVKDDLISRLSENTEGAVDTDSRVLEAYVHQCTAEAQEVTLARAVEMRHASSLIASLAFETGQMYQKADDALNSLDDKVVLKWRKYCQLKCSFYTSYAHCYNGETLLAQDKCGEAIRGLQEGVKLYERAEKQCKEYTSAKGLGTFARPANHLFFRKAEPVLKRILEKCDRENGLIYHQKVPFDEPVLELKATYGLVAPEVFAFPTINPLWTKDVYDKMNAKMAPRPDDNKDKSKKPEDLPPVKEKETPMSEKDPGNFSGCVVS